MRLTDLMSRDDLKTALEELASPLSAKPPQAKGLDAIKVDGYFVQGHWRRRWQPPAGYWEKRRRQRERLRLVTLPPAPVPSSSTPGRRRGAAG